MVIVIKAADIARIVPFMPPPMGLLAESATLSVVGALGVMRFDVTRLVSRARRDALGVTRSA